MLIFFQRMASSVSVSDESIKIDVGKGKRTDGVSEVG